MLDKIISLRTQWLADGRELINSPKVRANYILFSQNAGDIFRHNVMLGLIAWRKNIDPTAHFSEAVDDIIQYCHDLSEGDFSLTDMPLSSASLISSLIDRECNFSLNCEIGDAADLYLDCLIAEEISRRPETRSQKKGLEILAKSTRQAIAVRTYEVYFDILNNAKDMALLGELALHAERNYADRASDKFYSGGQDINGGGKYNEFVVDFRLGAILKHVGFTGASVHSWKW